MTDEKELPTVSKERLKELMARGREIRKAVQERFKPLLNVSNEKMNRRLK